MAVGVGERARVSTERGAVVVASFRPDATAARVAAALGAELAVGPLASRAAVVAAARSRRAARIRLVGERVLADHAAAAVPYHVRTARPDVVAGAARCVLDTERAAAAAAASVGEQPVFDPAAAVDAHLASAAAGAAGARAARSRGRLLGRDLAAANAVALVLLAAGARVLASGAGPTSSLVAALVVGAAVTTAAALLRATRRVRRSRDVAARADAAFRAALARTGAASLDELDARAAAHERWQRRRRRADELAREAARLRARWHELVGDVAPDDVGGLLAAAAWWRTVSATAAEARRAADVPRRPIVAAVERPLVAELLRAGAGVPLVLVVPG